MKTRARLIVLMLAAFWVPATLGQQAQRRAHIGYVYPAGGRRGTVVRVVVGGQMLKGTKDVHISGKGVRGKIIRHYRPFRNLKGYQRRKLVTELAANSEKEWAALQEKGQVKGESPWQRMARIQKAKEAESKEVDPNDKLPLPEHPLLTGLNRKDLRELGHVWYTLTNLRRRQLNGQIAETVVVEITIDPKANPGEREFRLDGSQGLTSPIVFHVGVSPEVRELENNTPGEKPFLPAPAPFDLPVVINGQIMPGDVDSFRFRAGKGQRILVQAHARRLIPFLADAVPGWFQATLSLRDAAGRELAFADDNRFDPDPMLVFEVPEGGEYELQIRDAIYRGREDFVYRVSVGEQAQAKRLAPAAIPGDVLDAAGKHAKRNEAEANDTAGTAQRITLPITVVGSIRRPGDADVFRFQGRAGAEIVAEITARRRHSPLDSLVRLTDASGHVLAWNDDHIDKIGHLHRGMGFLTHHADSYLKAKLPSDGEYTVQVTDARGHGGKAYAYRLRIGPPQPDFALRVTPSSVNARPGLASEVCVHALREDGFDGEIALGLKDAPPGFRLDGARIPAGRDKVRLTLGVPAKQLGKPVRLTLEGRAAGLRRTAVPADDVMQAFLWRHLVPRKALMVSVRGRGRGRRVLERIGDGRVRIPAGGGIQVQFRGPMPSKPRIEPALREPPEGVTLDKVVTSAGKLAFRLKADKKVAVGTEDNLIVEIIAHSQWKQKDGKVIKRSASVGVLPAIPFKIVRK